MTWQSLLWSLSLIIHEQSNMTIHLYNIQKDELWHHQYILTLLLNLICTFQTYWCQIWLCIYVCEVLIFRVIYWLNVSAGGADMRIVFIQEQGSCRRMISCILQEVGYLKMVGVHWCCGGKAIQTSARTSRWFWVRKWCWHTWTTFIRPPIKWTLQWSSLTTS